MFFEIGSTFVMAGVAGYTYLYQAGNVNESSKISRIAANSGLIVKEGKKTRTIQLLRRTKNDWGVEYCYRIPLGLSFGDFESKREQLQDGLRHKSVLIDISLDDIKQIDIKKPLLPQIRKFFAEKKSEKEIELEYDGALKICVYNEPLAILNKFEDEHFAKCKGWKIPVGSSRSEEFEHDFEKRPHMIVAGSTGFGKSEFIKLLVTVLINNQPDHVRFHLIDLKGGTELGRFKNLKQVVTFGRKPSDAKETLSAIQQDMDAKLDYLFENGVKDVKEAGQKERYFIVIDEAADIANDKDCMEIVTDISRRGRSAGYRLIYATQYPTNETLPSQVRANIGARVCFRLETGAQSRAVLDEGGAEALPEIEGRAIFRRVKNHVVQTPFIERSLIEKTITPHITIRPRKDDDNAQKSEERAAGGVDSFIVEEV
jgi:S-DNA-T family DNA segregation ATPase FtsK/SpoIIIE